MHSLCKFLLLCAATTFGSQANAQTIVQKTAEPFESAAWRGADDSSAGGSAKLSANVRGGIRPLNRKVRSIFEAEFFGQGL